MARRLARELLAVGLPCLIDPDLPQSDVFWRDALARRLTGCRLMACVCSPASNASPWVQQERRWFAGRGAAIEVVDAAGDPAAVSRIAAVYDRPRGAAAVHSLNHQSPERQDIELRRSLHDRGAAALADAQRRFGRRPKARRDGSRAWLADGRIELVRLPGSPFRQYIATEPVSNALYREFLAAEPSVGPPPTWMRPGWDTDERPVTGITWFEAFACASWFGGCLPAEASWQWAANGGAAGRIFATADGMLSLTQAHYGMALAEGSPAPSSAYPATPEGFRGLSGNTWDWCADGDAFHQAIRGGGWMDEAAFCRADARYRQAKVDRDACIGFRIALDPNVLRGVHA